MNAVKIKIISLGALAVIFSAALGYFFRLFLGGSDLGIFAIFLATAVLWVIAFLFQVFFIDNRSAAAIIFLQALVWGAIFWQSGAMTLLLPTLALLVVILFLAHRASSDEIKNAFQIRFGKIAFRAAARASTALAILVTVIYLDSIDFKGPVLAKRTLSAMLKPAEPIAARFLPGFKLEASLAQLASRLASAEVQPQAAEQLTLLVKDWFGVTAKPQDTVLDIVYRATVGKLLALPVYMQNIILAAVGILIFLTIKGFSFIINWLAVFLGFVGYEVLRSAGFYKISLESRSKEVIVL